MPRQASGATQQESFSLVSQWSARRLPASLPPSAGACSVTFAARTHATTHHHTTSTDKDVISVLILKIAPSGMAVNQQFTRGSSAFATILCHIVVT
ncbi:unnamed protein product [Plutella xylostella]|uniref:(diamondback moth) hypothetical protein n=1 Tax=Plutella xylostella TaxID=51655 RepID=A0A8S4E7R2_PLUXY|nr:unnamed protein product [Plutella xylostella]